MSERQREKEKEKKRERERERERKRKREKEKEREREREARSAGAPCSGGVKYWDKCKLRTALEWVVLTSSRTARLDRAH